MVSVRRPMFSTGFAMGLSRIDQTPANSFRKVELSLGIEVAMVHPRTAHRRNHDGSFDSICKTCFATVARSSDEAALAGPERNHACDLSVLIGREVPFRRVPRTGISLVPHPMEWPAVAAMGTGTSGLMQKTDI